MVFNSLVFLVFFAVVYGLYRALPHRGQNVLILVSSYFFYGWWDWRFLSLIFVSTVIDYVAARVIDDACDNRRRRRIAVGASIVSNLGLLRFFKYDNFFAERAIRDACWMVSEFVLSGYSRYVLLAEQGPALTDGGWLDLTHLSASCRDKLTRRIAQELALP